MTPAWFLIIFLASPAQGVFYPAQAREESFKTEKACMTEALTSPHMNFTNAGKPDPSLDVGFVCVKGYLKAGVKG